MSDVQSPIRKGYDTLSPTMRRHLAELAEIADGSARGEAHWYPASSGEWASANALQRRGYLSRNIRRGRQPFTATDLGLKIGRFCRAVQRGEA